MAEINSSQKKIDYEKWLESEKSIRICVVLMIFANIVINP